MSRGPLRLEGAFREETIAPGFLRLTLEAPRAEVYVIGVSRRVPLSAAVTEVPRLEIEWLGEEARLTLHAPPRVERLTARQVLVHEPKAALYGQLPLARFDARARRFWARVFLLARLPGGRRLLSWLARRR